MKFFKVLIRGLSTKTSWARNLDKLLMLLTIAGMFCISMFSSLSETDDKFGLVVTNIVIATLISILWLILDYEKCLPVVSLIKALTKAKKAYDEVHDDMITEEYKRKAQSGDISIAKGDD